MHRLLLSAAHKSSGKTTLAIGLCAAFAAQGLRVQPFKKGPDYIDPLWLGQASARPCINLDPYLMPGDALQRRFAQHAQGADLCVVEGNKGLFDGLSLDGSNSNAALAHLLGLPVVLVIDARGMTRGVAPLLLGYQAFDRGLRIGGVILNRLGGSRHEAKLRAVIEHYTDIPVLGAVAEQPDLALCERHLGLIPSNEHPQSLAQIHRMGQRIAAQVDLPRLLQLARGAPSLRSPNALDSNPIVLPHGSGVGCRPEAPLRIAVAQDAAFGFYYPDDLQALRAQGAQLLPLDMLHDEDLPAGVDGLFIGGGFPEHFLQPLADNVRLRQRLAQAIARGLPTYAECGGLMVLARSITAQEHTYPMVGAIAGDVHMHARPVGRGYVHLRASAHMPWAGLRGAQVRAHEFHYSSLLGLPENTRFAWDVERGHGIDGQHDGIVQDALLASYSHLHDAAGSDWTRHFLAAVRAASELPASTGGYAAQGLLHAGAALQ